MSFDKGPSRASGSTLFGTLKGSRKRIERLRPALGPRHPSDESICLPSRGSTNARFPRAPCHAPIFAASPSSRARSRAARRLSSSLRTCSPPKRGVAPRAVDRGPAAGPERPFRQFGLCYLSGRPIRSGPTGGLGTGRTKRPLHNPVSNRGRNHRLGWRRRKTCPSQSTRCSCRRRRRRCWHCTSFPLR